MGGPQSSNGSIAWEQVKVQDLGPNLPLLNLNFRVWVPIIAFVTRLLVIVVL